MSKFAGINNAEISSGQAAKILIMFAQGSAALILPSAVTAIAKQDGWLSMLIAGPFNYFILLVYLALADRFPNMSLAQYAEKIVGKWAGKALTFIYILFFLLLSALVLRNISDFMSLSVLPLTPEWFIDSTFMLVVIYGVFLGIETIARTGEILFGWGMLVIVIIIFSLFNQFSFQNFEPVLYEGVLRPLKGVYPILGFPIGEFVFITAILPLVRKQDRKKLRKSLKTSVLLITFLSVLITVFLVGVMGVDETSRSPFAVYDMAKNINIEEILVRVEILVAMVWIGTVFMKLALCVYVLAVLTAQMLNLSTYRTLIVPYAFIIVPLSLIAYRNVAHSRVFAMGVWTVYSLFHGFLLPFLLLMIAMIRKQRDSSDGGFPEIKPQKSQDAQQTDMTNEKIGTPDQEPAKA
ncbi:spore germination protein KB [Paenibacillus endophyticus]|uniref:Spore germination protein KB n=1 Tax=Paenibacillus endophyticus TaxID=1294268 RepID=A0A7W5CBC2_9BACL|nr:endospore germination permease [Paenibacillus endophyticus]MBB3154578.1 spore germination protein KB [Paenibacillus endophyticus]